MYRVVHCVRTACSDFDHCFLRNCQIFVDTFGSTLRLPSICLAGNTESNEVFAEPLKIPQSITV